MTSKTRSSTSLAIVGGGNMGEALISGLLRGANPLLEPGQIAVVEHNRDRAMFLRDRFGVATMDMGSAVQRADTILITVKPYHVDTVLAEMADDVTADHLIVSAAGGITTTQIEEGLTTKAAVIRCMPNTAASVGEGMTAISAGSYAEARHLDRTRVLLESVGRVIQVPEYQLDAVTALSGSGPAYFFFLAEAMIDAGVLLGLSRSLAAELVTQTAAGSGIMLRDSGEDPVNLRAAVSSPGGTTIAAISQLESRAVRFAMMAAAEAARDRSVELGQRATR
jgi:pyrroline-5-carboxylate reductase